jgi:hypothetical protein
MAEQSTAKQNALTERVFARLAIMYGNKFADMWRGIDLSEVKRAWGDELASFTVSEVAGAIKALRANTFPPTLPEFLQLCEKARGINPAYVAAHQQAMKLPPPDTSAESAARRREAAQLLRNIGKPKPGLEWARKARARNLSGEHRLTPSELVIVDDALRFEPVEVAA